MAKNQQVTGMRCWSVYRLPSRRCRPAGLPAIALGEAGLPAIALAEAGRADGPGHQGFTPNRVAKPVFGINDWPSHNYSAP